MVGSGIDRENLETGPKIETNLSLLSLEAQRMEVVARILKARLGEGAILTEEARKMWASPEVEEQVNLMERA